MEVTDPKMVDVMICKLRRKLREVDMRFADAIKTIWGLGYHIEQPMKALLMAALVPQAEPQGSADDSKAK
jgi:DNA-binding winged helix-turn-helix (wHTH) protein